MRNYLFIFLIFSIFLPFKIFSANQADLEKLFNLNKSPKTMDLSHADLRQYPLNTDINLQKANLSHSNLSGMDLSKINLGGANLAYANLSRAKLNQTNLADANLQHADLSNSEIQKSDLSRANLSYADLTHANLQNSIFTKTILTCAKLDSADLTAARFTETNISGISLINTITNDILDYDTVIDNNTPC